MSAYLNNKKLLVLGGNALSIDIVKQANKMGVHTIVTDWNNVNDSPAKLYASEYWNISLLDYDTLISKIKESHIDGIITGFTDSYLLPYQYLCEKCNLPCYATKQQFELTLDKSLFKATCNKYNVPTVPEYSINGFDKNIISESNKVILKPVDNSGSRGICICDTPESFDNKLKYAQSFSAKKQVIIEQYMDCDDVSFEYKIQNGEVILSAICDREIYKTTEFGSITSRLIYPSKYINVYLQEVNQKVINMFHCMHLSDGVLFMQAFVKNNQFYFYEMGYRLSGGRHYIFTEHQNTTNACKELIQFALSGNMSEQQLSQVANPVFPDLCIQLSIICKSETINSIEGWEYITKLPQVIDATKYYNPGDSIGQQGTTASIFARLHLVCKDEEQYKTLLQDIQSNLQVYNKDKQNIIIRI